MGFFKSIINQVGRDVGKSISNKLLKDSHSTPIRMVGKNGGESNESAASGCGCLFLLALVSVIGYSIYSSSSSEDPTFSNINIGDEILYKSEMDDVDLYQKGKVKLDKNEQERSDYLKEYKYVFSNTNTISKKYFVENKTDKIGVVLDTIPMKDGHLWLKVQLDRNIYSKPIEFDDLSDEFNVKLKLIKSNLFGDKFTNDVYIKLCSL